MQVTEWFSNIVSQQFYHKSTQNRVQCILWKFLYLNKSKMTSKFHIFWATHQVIWVVNFLKPNDNLYFFTNTALNKINYFFSKFSLFENMNWCKTLDLRWIFYVFRNCTTITVYGTCVVRLNVGSQYIEHVRCYKIYNLS